MVNTIVEVYLNLVEGPQLFQALLLQAVWFIGLAMAGQLVLHLGVRKLVIQGG